MLSTKTNNINALAINHNIPSVDESQWLDIKHVKNIHESIQLYKRICIEYTVSNKWVLLINPECESFEGITPTTVHQNNILRVHTNQGRLNIDNIAKALLKGNCSAIVLCDIEMNNNELARIKACASIGETKCIILAKEETLH